MADAAALVAAFETHGPALLRYARYRTPTEEDAEDVVQETWLRAWKAHETLWGSGRALSNWLYRTEHNVLIDQQRRTRLVTWELLTDDYEDGQNVEEVVEARMDVAAVRDAVGELTEAERTALVYRALYGISTAETAREMGVSEEAVKQDLLRARRKMRKVLDAPAGRDD